MQDLRKTEPILREESTNSELERPITSRTVFQSPLILGLVIITVMTGAIIGFGSNLLPEHSLNSIHQGQIEDLDRFSSVIHLGSAEITGSGAAERLVNLVETDSFDSLMKRGMFGAHAQSLDLYSLTGEPLYSTGSVALPLSESMSLAHDDARHNQPASIHMQPDAAFANIGAQTDILQTYKLIWNQPPGNGQSARPLMVAAITTDVSRELGIANRSIWLIAGVFNAGMVLVLVVLHWASGRSQLRLEKANHALAAQNRAVRDSRERMVQAADSTKRAIAEELHGTVQSKLFASWMQLVQFKESIPEASEDQLSELDRIAQEIDDIREEDIRGISHRLHPSIVRVGAGAGLRSLRNFYESLVPVELTISPSATELEPTGTSVIPDDVRLGVYRTAELAMGNVAKHAQASVCRVDWDYDTDAQELIMSVSDDGIGFDTSKGDGGGLGMVNIYDYADAMNATFKVESKRGHGTTLILTIPFVAPPSALAELELSDSPVEASTEQSPAA